MAVSGGLYVTKTLQDAADDMVNGEVLVITDRHSGALSRLAVDITISNTATVAFEATMGDAAAAEADQSSVTWRAFRATATSSGTAAATATASGLFTADVTGFSAVRFRVSAYTSGTVTVVARAIA